MVSFRRIFFVFSSNPGITAAPTAARMPMIATTIRSSMRVNPFLFIPIILPQYRYGIKGEISGGKGRFLVGVIVVIRWLFFLSRH